MFCSKCGIKLEDTEKFCHKCGAQCQAVKEITEKNEGGNEVKKKRNVITATLLGILLLIIVMFLILGRKECEWCGNIYYGASYYDPYDEEDIMCEECAKEYFCGLPYEGYRVR